jgi:hypothetical protein
MTRPSPWRQIAAHLRDHVDPNALSTELLAVYHRTMQPTQVSLLAVIVG